VKIEWKTAAEVLEERKNVERLPTGTPIDELIGGGIEKGEVIEFYGDRSIFFIRKGKGGTRIAKLVDSSMYPPAERPFVITERELSR
jgi:hypothetical protein